MESLLTAYCDLMAFIDQYDLLAFSCINAPTSLVSEWIEQVIAGFPSRFRYRRAPLDLPSIYVGEPQPGGAHPTRYALWRPEAANQTSLFMANLTDGWYSLIWCLSRQFKCECVSVRISQRRPCPVQSFCYHAGGREQRVIQVLRDDGGWKFFDRGAHLPFEQISDYQRHRVKDRFTSQHILSYLRQMGWDVRDDRTWQSSESAFYGRELRTGH